MIKESNTDTGTSNAGCQTAMTMDKAKECKERERDVHTVSILNSC